MISLEHYLAVAAMLFVIGVFGIFLNRKNVIIILMSVELLLLAVNINLVAFSAHLGDFGRAGVFPIRPNRSGGRGGDWAGNSGMFLSQSWLYRG